ncbi:MAG: dihydroxyacetone kinase subunit L [Gammaproteobacteria bacterium]|nr:dihydroxyacetone kinase subunit L [Gammaproteobacteria bacterium]
MQLLTSSHLISIFHAMGDAIEREKDQLCVLDGKIGDADHGITMSIGFTAIRKALGELDPETATPSDVFNTAAKSFLSAVGASAGPLYATAFMRAAAAVKGQNVLDTAALASSIAAMAEGIQSRGKAEPGDKTMLDSWLPAACVATECNDNTTLKELMVSVKQAAEKGAQATVAMLAKKGRSAKLGERSIGHQDAGAASTAILLGAMAESIEQL